MKMYLFVIRVCIYIYIYIYIELNFFLVYLNDISLEKIMASVYNFVGIIMNYVNDSCIVFGMKN